MKIDTQNKTITLQDGDEIFLHNGTYVKVRWSEKDQDFVLFNYSSIFKKNHTEDWTEKDLEQYIKSTYEI